MTVKSEERSTGMGATQYSAILRDGQWVRVSDLEGARYLGRDCGVEKYSIEVPEGTAYADFYRSNRGNERVTIYLPEAGWEDHGTFEIGSFSEAHRWAQEVDAE